MKTEFYKLLSENDDFCKTLGKVMLAASKLEIELKQYLRLHGEDVSEKRATLGNLIQLLKKNGHLTRNGEMHFGQINLQRNYLVHNLYASFVGEIEDWLLPIDDLVPEDVEVYVEKTEQTAEGFEIYSKIVCEALNKMTENSEPDTGKVAPLL